MNGVVSRGLLTGAAMTAACGATMAISSFVQRGSPWAGLNAMATGTGVRKRRFGVDYDADVTPIGLAVLAGGLLAHGIVYQRLLGKSARRRPIAAGIVSALAGYALDRYVLPDQVLPSFRRSMGPAGTFAKYAALGLASAAAASLRRPKLAGRRIAVLAADGFEQVELTGPVRALRDQGADVEVISLRRGKIVGMNVNMPGRRVRVDQKVDDAIPAFYDGLLVPGGFINPDFLRQSEEARAFVRSFDNLGKPIATICHGPWVLASAGVLRGRQLTSWPGIRDDLVNAGAVWRDEAVVRDGNLISSRGPADLRAFTRAMIELFSGRAVFARRAAPALSSAPQRRHPPRAALASAALLPRLGRVALGLGALGVASIARAT